MEPDPSLNSNAQADGGYFDPSEHYGLLTDFDNIQASDMRLDDHRQPELSYKDVLLGSASVFDPELSLTGHQVQPDTDWNMMDANVDNGNQAIVLSQYDMNNFGLGEPLIQDSLTTHAHPMYGDQATGWEIFNNSRITDLDVSELHPSSGLAEERTLTTSGQHTARDDFNFGARGSSITAADNVAQRTVSSRTNPGPEDWVKHRRLISRLYERMTLPKVMRHLEDEHGFFASTKMYKTRIAQWGLDNKNNRGREMKAAVRKLSQRTQNGKASTCRIRGKQVDYEEMVRYYARKRMSIEDVVALRKTSTTPETVVCLTPVPSPIPNPGAYEAPELLFQTLRNYVAGSFDSGVWVRTEQTSRCYSVKETEISADVFRFGDYRMELCGLLDFGLHQEAKIVQRPATTHVRRLLLSESPYSFFEIINFVKDMFTRGRLETALYMLKTIADLGSSILGQNHPLPTIARILVLINRSYIVDVSDRCFRTLADQFEGVLGSTHVTSIDARSSLGQTSEKHARGLFYNCKAELGLEDIRTLKVQLLWTWTLYENRFYQQGISESEWFLGLPIVAQPATGLAIEMLAQNLYLLAHSQYKVSRTQCALSSLREAISIVVSHQDPWDSRARRWVILLQRWLAECGREEELAEARRWWILMIKAESASHPQSNPTKAFVRAWRYYRSASSSDWTHNIFRINKNISSKPIFQGITSF